jgi:pimeloyl-ACP methyl ester carboxylesterase
MVGGSPRERGPLSTNAAVVVYVHGLWMSGGESLFLRRRLANDFGFEVRAFRYAAASSTMPQIVAGLQALVEELRPWRLHFVGHSLGGLVIYRFFERFPRQAPGRVVFLGTPSVASRAAVQASHIRLVANLMGQPVADELLQPHERRWTLADRQLGVIAGTQALGIGQILAQFEEDCDGTIAVSETLMPGATEHLRLPVSHAGMLVSPRVARETGEFLAHGRFARE